MEATRRAVIVKECGQDRIGVLGQGLRKDALSFDDVALFIDGNFVKAERGLAILCVSPALLADVINNLVALLFGVAVMP